MSDQVQLSAYSEAIQNLIQGERYDQAIALCQHILHYYPKNIATYRQMAEANLEKGDHNSAAELFRRVLSADPEDYVAYAGLAVIFERQALIDEAVWHLERAFELNPSLAEIRNELLRLYGERDSRPQTRLRLTPGALARLYVREGLFAQAVQEFRAILSQAPRRLDARLALAEALWHSGQMRDSAQVCQEVLQALPYCLKANLILAQVMQESGAGEVETYLQSAQALDPTNRVAQEMFGEQSPLQAAEVFVPQYVEPFAPVPTAEETPAQAKGFEDWFVKEPAESEPEGFGALSETPIEGMATTPPPTPFEQWPPVVQQQTQEPPSQEDWTGASSIWLSQISVPSEPAESTAAETPPTDETLPTNQGPPAAEEASPETQPQLPTPRPELPPWLQSDVDAAPSPPAPQPIVPSAPSLPPWLIEFQKIYQADGSTEPATREAERESTQEPLPEWTVEPSESGETQAPPPTAEQEAQVALPDWLATTQVQAAAAGVDTALPPETEEKPFQPTPDWLKGLPEEISQEPAPRVQEERAAQEAGDQKEQPIPAAETLVEIESEIEPAPPMSQEQIAAQSDVYAREGESLDSGALATEAPVTPAEAEPEGESETVILYEEAADRELYGDQTAAPASEGLGAVDELAAKEAESVPAAPGAPAPVETNAQEESPPSESLRRRRDPKGYSHLVQARAHYQDNRLGEALKEYDYVVQHSPRLVNAVIADLEELVRRMDVPLEAHRILGDAYTRADRLADALERYRFVLERVS